MNTIDHPSTRTYYIARDDAKVIGYGYVDPENRLDCASQYFELFPTESAMHMRLIALGTEPNSLVLDPNANPILARLIIGAQVNKLREEKFILPVSFLAHTFDNDDVSRANLTGLLNLIRDGMPLPNGFTWRSSDNQDIPANAGFLRGLAMALFVYRTKCYQTSWAIKAALEAAEDPTLIDINLGWPDPSNP